jgi:hypothetical protein
MLPVQRRLHARLIGVVGGGHTHARSPQAWGVATARPCSTCHALLANVAFVQARLHPRDLALLFRRLPRRSVRHRSPPARPRRQARVLDARLQRRAAGAGAARSGAACQAFPDERRCRRAQGTERHVAERRTVRTQSARQDSERATIGGATRARPACQAGADAQWCGAEGSAQQRAGSNCQFA